MAITSARRIQVAQEFVRMGFGDTVDDSDLFHSQNFVTQELTTTEVQSTRMRTEPSLRRCARYFSMNSTPTSLIPLMTAIMFSALGGTSLGLNRTCRPGRAGLRNSGRHRGSAGISLGKLGSSDSWRLCGSTP